MLDYIYLVIIILLLSSIVFIINLSYEYRQRSDTHSNLESFVVPTIGAFPQDNSILTKKILDFKNNYNNLATLANNNQILIDQNDYVVMNEKIKQNLADANKLSDLNSGIKPIKTQYPLDKLIKTIKSNYNSQFISLITNDTDKYGVVVNDKCVTVRGSSCPDSFCLQNCQDNLYTTDSQKFSSKRIQNVFDAAKIMNTTTDKISGKLVYPFNVFQSNVNNQCLSINDDGVNIEPCNVNNIHQQWQISPDENICLLK